MKNLRRILFWVHLVVGLAAGGVIAITVFTGACMAFEKQVLAWVERDLRRVVPPSSGADRIELDALVARAREQSPRLTLAAVTVKADPTAAVVLSFGRTNIVYANPYTGDLRSPGPTAWRAFFQLMLQWHRWLGVPADAPAAPPAVAQAAGESGVRPSSLGEMPSGSSGGPGIRDSGIAGAERPRREGPGGARAVAGTVVGVSACLFGLLCVSGICLWWPRSWSGRALRAVLIPNLRLRGKARDWNWHHALGLWSAPFLLVMSLTGAVMAFRPVGDVVYGAAEGRQGAGPNRPTTFSAPEPGLRPLGPERWVAIAEREVPDWEEITIRPNGRPRGPRGGGGAGSAGSDAAASGPVPGRGVDVGGGEGSPGNRRATEEPGIADGARGSGEWRGDGAGRGASGGRGLSAVSLTVRESRGALQPIQILLHPYTGEVLSRTSFSSQWAELGGRRALRGLNRTIHTGEAGGLLGQSLAFLACLGGLVLVSTGFALSGRRFLGKRRGRRAMANAMPGLRGTAVPAAAKSAPQATPCRPPR